MTEKNIPVTEQLNRIDLGVYNNQEWSHYGIMLGEEFLYRNPFGNARLNDDEIAVATCMMKMADYLENGIEFYSLKEALQDVYLPDYGRRTCESKQRNKNGKTDLGKEVMK